MAGCARAKPAGRLASKQAAQRENRSFSLVPELNAVTLAVGWIHDVLSVASANRLGV